MKCNEKASYWLRMMERRRLNDRNTRKKRIKTRRIEWRKELAKTGRKQDKNEEKSDSFSKMWASKRRINWNMGISEW